MADTCPTCGQRLPPDLPLHLLTAMQRRICEILLRAGTAGCNSDRLFELLYRDDSNGGPLSGKKSMYVMVRALNQRLGARGIAWRVRAPGAGRSSSTNYGLERFAP